MDLMTRRDFIEAGLPATLAAVAALHPALPTEKPPEGDTCIAARWIDRNPDHAGLSPSYLLAVGPTPLLGQTCSGSIEGVLFAYQPGRTQWYFRVGSAVTNFEAPDLPAAKKVAEVHMVEVVRECLVQLEKLAFALRRQ